MRTHSLSLRMHPLRYMLRLDGWADISHPEYGAGAEFHMVIPTYIIEEDLAAYATRLAANDHQGFEASQVHGEVVWDSGARSEIIWVESRWSEYPDTNASPKDEEGRVSLSIDVCDPWPSTGAAFTSHRLFDLPASVPSMIVNAVGHWVADNTDIAEIALLALAGVGPHEGNPGQDVLATMAALRLPGGLPAQRESDRFSLPL